jgi:GNAT superfamily N-acetyltransferase
MSEIAIVPFRRDLAPAFRSLNLDWIERLFKVEPADLKVLDDPEAAIVARGGMIFFALQGETPVGTVAMIPAGAGRFELAKMAVATTHQRRGIGEMLGAAAIAWAREAGVRQVCLETNSKLADAIRLYERLGFRQMAHPHASDYSRCNVYMELPIASRGS